MLAAFTLGGGEVAAEGTPAPVPPGTAAMAERLRAVRDAADPRRNGYLNDRRAALAREQLASGGDGSPRWEIRARFFLAQELLYAGQNDAAIEELVRVQALIASLIGQANSRDARRVRDLLAVAHLRIGETENCCARHNPDSCFVPIRGQGVHTLERGSRGAIRYLTEALEDNPGDLASRWLLNLAYMTLGEHPEQVPERWLIPEQAFASDHELPRFPDVGRQAGVDVMGMAGGSVMEDFDGDGLLDLMCSSWGLDDQVRLLRSAGDGTFEDRTAEAGLNGIVGGLNMTHADYDNDGRADVLVLRGAWWHEQGRHPNSLLRNLGDGRFEDVTEAAGLLSLHPTQTAAWGDYDNDGWLDLYVGNESSPRGAHPCELYRNNGDGTFTECASDAGVDHEAYVKGVAWGDYDNDGRLDLYLSAQGGANVLYHNDGPGDDAGSAWRFTDVTAATGVAEPHGSFPTWFWDYDNDGWLDLFVSGYRWSSVGDAAADMLGLPHGGETPRLYRNNGDGTFTESAARARLDRLVLAMGANYGDLDNDGFPDFYAGTGEPDYRAVVPNLMFRNDGGGGFQDVTTAGGFGNVQKGHGIAFGDLDNDGDQDIYAVMGGSLSGDVYQNLLFENPGFENRWLTIVLRGRRSNRAGLGARIHVRVETAGGERDVHVAATTGGSFGSSSLQQEIGLGAADSIRFVRVTWPASGTTQEFRDVPLDRFVEITEGDGELRLLERPRIRLGG